MEMDTNIEDFASAHDFTPEEVQAVYAARKAAARKNEKIAAAGEALKTGDVTSSIALLRSAYGM